MMPTFLLSIALLAFQQATAVQQHSTGWCSPNIANVTGNVTVNCIGVDPRALRVLNQQLSKMQGTLDQKIQEANDWADKYHELERRLRESGDDTELSKRAEEYIHQGEFERAGAILDEILKKEEKQVDRTAANHYNRALAFLLQFSPVEALPHLEKAHRYRPDDIQYGLAYAYVLLEEKDFVSAEPLLQTIVQRARELARTNSPTCQACFATALSFLASLYGDTGRLSDAEVFYQEALTIDRIIAQSNPIYKRDVARVLNDLAIIYSNTQRFKEATETYQAALQTLKELTSTNSSTHDLDIATTLNNLGMLFHKMQHLNEAQVAFENSLAIFRRLGTIYQPGLADVLSNLGNLHRDMDQWLEAAATYEEALDFWRQVTKTNPTVYDSDLAKTLCSLADAYQHIHRTSAARIRYREALTIYRKLSNVSQETYASDIAGLLNSLARLDFDNRDFQLATKEIEEAVRINRERWKITPTLSGDDLAMSLLIASVVRTQADECGLLREAEKVVEHPELRNLVTDRIAACACSRWDQ